MPSQKFVYTGGEGEIEEKRSRFIASVRPVSSEEEALEMIAGIKKKYWNARHNCFAYVIGERSQLQRCSDDGEPQGTAGRPMLDVLLGEDIHDVCVVVTRYFGGILLGTGGLVRAYSQAVQEGLRNSEILLRQEGVRLVMQTDYTGLGKIQYLLGQRGIPVLNSDYSDVVRLEAVVPAEQVQKLREAVTEGTNGKTQFQSETECIYALRGQEVLLLS